jgi:hypothetical protein
MKGGSGGDWHFGLHLCFGRRDGDSTYRDRILSVKKLIAESTGMIEERIIESAL